MHRLHVTPVGLLVLGLLALAPPAASAQSSSRNSQTPAQNVTTSDVQRLQDTVYNISSDVSRLRARDPQLDREVAVKVIPEELASQKDRLRHVVRHVTASTSFLPLLRAMWSPRS